MTDIMADQSLALEVGKLTGTVNGLIDTLKSQNQVAAETRKEQNDTAEKSRAEFMEIFKGMREDIKSSNKLVQDHMQLDAPIHDTVRDMEPKVATLWDNQNKQKGIFLAVGTVGTILGGVIVAGMEWLKK